MLLEPYKIYISHFFMYKFLIYKYYTGTINYFSMQLKYIQIYPKCFQGTLLKGPISRKTSIHTTCLANKYFDRRNEENFPVWQLGCGGNKDFRPEYIQNIHVPHYSLCGNMPTKKPPVRSPRKSRWENINDVKRKAEKSRNPWLNVRDQSTLL